MKYNNTKMFKVINIIFIFIFLYACGQDNAPNKIKLSSLIDPEFTYTQDLFDCELNKNEFLIALEAFFSKNIKKYKDLAELENLNISILFPEQNNNITNFIISITSNNNHLGLKKFIDSIKDDSFSDVALCSFAIYQHKGINFIEQKSFNNDSFITTEILRCKFNDGYNFGTFQIAINRFLNDLRFIELPYSISYLEDSSLDNGFIWINYFYKEDYQELLLDSWINNQDSAQIKNEFSQNAACIESNKYKSFKLI